MEVDLKPPPLPLGGSIGGGIDPDWGVDRPQPPVNPPSTHPQCSSLKPHLLMVKLDFFWSLRTILVKHKVSRRRHRAPPTPWFYVLRAGSGVLAEMRASVPACCGAPAMSAL